MGPEEVCGLADYAAGVLQGGADGCRQGCLQGGAVLRADLGESAVSSGHTY